MCQFQQFVSAVCVVWTAHCFHYTPFPLHIPPLSLLLADSPFPLPTPLSVVPRSFTVAWHISCTLSSTGWAFLIVSVTRSRRSTWWIAVHPSPTSTLRSARRHLLAVQRYRLYTYRRAFTVSAPSNLEFTAGLSAGSGTEFRLLQTTAEDGTCFSYTLNMINRWR